MKRFLFAFVVSFFVLAAPQAQQIITKSSPVTPPQMTGCQLIALHIYPSISDISQARIVIDLAGNNGEAIPSQLYGPTTSPTAQTLLSNLNKANFSGGNASFLAQVYMRIATDVPICAGNVTGSPQ